MTIIYKDGVYTVNAEQTDCTELIREMALAIHQLSCEESNNFKTTVFEEHSEN